MKIIYSELLEKEGNDCLIKDDVILIEVHDKFVVEDVRKYVGSWCGNHGLDFRCLKEFDSYPSAKKYYDSLIKRGCNI